jgi:hypothetical protein
VLLGWVEEEEKSLHYFEARDSNQSTSVPGHK